MRSLISQKWNLKVKAHMWYQLSPFTGSNVAIAMQHGQATYNTRTKVFPLATLSP